MSDSVEDLLANFSEMADVVGLGQLSRLCAQMATASEEVIMLENQLAEKKKALYELRIGKIPSLMDELHLKEIRLDNGATIEIKRKVSCKFVATTKPEALDWLDEHGESDSIRREVSVGFEKGDTATAIQAVTVLEKAGLHPSVIMDMHHSTLSAWARRRVEAGEEVPTNLFNFDVFNYAEVKHGK